jgi:hypothetical protein
MPCFSVILSGEGISVPSGDTGGDDPREEIIGFYTTRWVLAQDVERAKEAAAHLVQDDWTVGEYAKINRGNPPKVRGDSIREISGWKYWLSRKPSGHTFYAQK